jgi:hypothetical protein
LIWCRHRPLLSPTRITDMLTLAQDDEAEKKRCSEMANSKFLPGPVRCLPYTYLPRTHLSIAQHIKELEHIQWVLHELKNFPDLLPSTQLSLTINEFHPDHDFPGGPERGRFVVVEEKVNTPPVRFYEDVFLPSTIRHYIRLFCASKQPITDLVLQLCQDWKLQWSPQDPLLIQNNIGGIPVHLNFLRMVLDEVIKAHRMDIIYVFLGLLSDTKFLYQIPSLLDDTFQYQIRKEIRQRLFPEFELIDAGMVH